MYHLLGYRFGDYEMDGRKGQYLHLYVSFEDEHVEGMRADRLKASVTLADSLKPSDCDKDYFLNFDRYGKVTELIPVGD